MLGAVGKSNKISNNRNKHIFTLSNAYLINGKTSCLLQGKRHNKPAAAARIIVDGQSSAVHLCQLFCNAESQSKMFFIFS